MSFFSSDKAKRALENAVDDLCSQFGKFEVYWHKPKVGMKQIQNELDDINAQVAKLAELNLKADPSFTSQLAQLRTCSKEEMGQIKMSFELLNAELKVPDCTDDEEFLKLRLSDTLRGLIECTEQGMQSVPDINKKIKELVGDVDSLKRFAGLGMDVFLRQVFN